MQSTGQVQQELSHLPSGAQNGSYDVMINPFFFGTQRIILEKYFNYCMPLIIDSIVVIYAKIIYS